MRKEAIILALMIILIQFQLVTAKIICSDNSTVSTDQEEINLGTSRSINGLGIGVIKTDEINVFRRVIADLLIDTARVELSNQTLSQKIELLSGSYTVTLGNVSESTAKITIEGESKEITKDEEETIKGLITLLTKVEISEVSTTAKLIIGAKKISLSNDQHPTEKLTFGTKTFIVQLSSASEANALVKVSKCNSGEISEIVTEIPKNQTQENKNQTNQSIINNTQINNNTLENNLTNQTQKGTIIEQTPKKLSLWRRILNWFKRLFGSD